MRPPRWLAGLSALLAISWCGCTTNIDFFNDGVASDGGAGTGEGDGAGGEPVGEQIHLGGTTPDWCAASLAATTLRQALCTCNNLSPQGSLRMLDDARPRNQPPVASVATNGILSMSGDYNIAGALYVLKDLNASGPGAEGFVQTSLRVGGSVYVTSRLEVRGDAYVGGAIPSLGSVEIAGTLYIPQFHYYPPDIADRVAHDFDPAMLPQCSCDTGLIPVVPLVAQRAVHNDNKRVPLDPRQLVGSAGGTRVDLPAGHFYVTGISTLGALTLAVHGPAALYVDGAVLLGGSLDVKLDPGASLDLVFTGDLLFSADDATAGNIESPSRVRLWASTAGQLSVSSSRSRIGAAIHAPAARLNAPHGVVLHGAALVRDVKTGFDDWLEIHYDRALLGIGHDVCGTPTATPLN